MNLKKIANFTLIWSDPHPHAGVLSAGKYVLKIYDHKCCNERVWFLHEQFGFSLQYWHEQGFLLVWVLSLKWNLVQSSRFQCPHCKSKFSQKHNLKRHVKQKPEENVPLLEDFKCKLCSKVFSTKDILLNHEESVHTVHEIVMLNRKAKSPTPVSQHYRILLATDSSWFNTGFSTEYFWTQFALRIFKQ